MGNVLFLGLMTNGVLLPEADRGVVPRENLEGYLLNLRHEVGRHKARVSGAALGIHRGDWEYLRDRIIHGIRTAPAREVRETPRGRLFEAVIPVDGLTRQTRRVQIGRAHV